MSSIDPSTIKTTFPTIGKEDNDASEFHTIFQNIKDQFSNAKNDMEGAGSPTFKLLSIRKDGDSDGSDEGVDIDVAGDGDLIFTPVVNGTLQTGKRIRFREAENNWSIDGGLAIGQVSAAAPLDVGGDIARAGVLFGATAWGHASSMDQGVASADAVAFASVDTGQGANELYPMDQAVRSSDTPTFAGASLTAKLATSLGSTHWNATVSDDSNTQLLQVLDSGGNIVGDLTAIGLDGLGAGKLNIRSWDRVEIDGKPARGEGIQSLGTISTDTTIGWAGGHYAKATLGGSLQLSLSNLGTDSEKVFVEVTQDSTGGRDLTWDTANILFPGGSAPTETSSAGATDLFEFQWNGSNFILTNHLADVK